MTDAPQYTFTVTRGDEPDTVVLLMRDAWGWEIRGVAKKRAEGGYAGTAIVGDPGRLALPLVDE